MADVERLRATLEERIKADELQQLAKKVRASNEPTTYMKTVHATGSGWVEIQADYLEALLTEMERLRAWKEARIENHPTDLEFYGR